MNTESENHETMELVDIGANLTHPSFDSDLEQVIARSKKAGK